MSRFWGAQWSRFSRFWGALWSRFSRFWGALRSRLSSFWGALTNSRRTFAAKVVSRLRRTIWVTECRLGIRHHGMRGIRHHGMRLISHHGRWANKFSRFYRCFKFRVIVRLFL